MIPSQCIQLRNVVLSAFPSTLTLPDPHVVDIHSELGPIPPILSDFTSMLGDDLRSRLEQYLMNRSATTPLDDLKEKILLPTPPPTAERYNTTLINAVILFIGATSVAQSKARTGSSLFSPSDPGPELVKRLASSMDVEGV